jgi:hypothetical protein
VSPLRFSLAHNDYFALWAIAQQNLNLALCPCVANNTATTSMWGRAPDDKWGKELLWQITTTRRGAL